MKLLLDTYVCESALFPNPKFDNFLASIRIDGTSYETCTKYDIFRYSFESYFGLGFKELFVNVDFENKEDEVNFLKFYNNFNIKIGRSSNKHDYLNVFSKFNLNDWIFFTPNNDHPYISNDNSWILYFEDIANEISLKYSTDFVSIFYSHFTESISSLKNNSYLFNNDISEVLEENENYYVVKFKNLQFVSIQVLKARFLIHLFKLIPEGEHKIIRLEDLSKHINFDIPTISIIPRMELCRHFDSYLHTIFHHSRFIKPNIVPPLFIPKGYFQEDIKIRVGHSDYKYGYVNINAEADKFVFENRLNGIDLKIKREHLPYFWEPKISLIEIAPDFDESVCTSGINPIWLVEMGYFGTIRKWFRKFWHGRLHFLYMFMINKLFWALRSKL